MAAASTPQFAQTQNVTVSNTTTETSLLTGTKVGSTKITGGTLSAGSVIFVRASGTLSTKAMSPGTLTFRLKLPSGTTSLTIAGGPNVNLNLVPWVFYAMITIYTGGGSGKYYVTGEWRLYQSTVSIYGVAGVGTNVTIDTTMDETFDLTAQWQIADGSNSLTIINCSVELLTGLT